MSDKPAPKLIGQLQHKPGLTLFEFNPETKEVRKADIKTTSVFISSSPNESTTTTTMMVVTKPGHIYAESLNLKNAKRKFLKSL